MTNKDVFSIINNSFFQSLGDAYKATCEETKRSYEEEKRKYEERYKKQKYTYPHKFKKF